MISNAAFALLGYWEDNNFKYFSSCINFYFLFINSKSRLRLKRKSRIGVSETASFQLNHTKYRNAITNPKARRKQTNIGIY